MKNSMIDRTYWIIGASSGIGRALSIELAKKGATLVISSRDENLLISLHEQLDKSNGQTHLVIPCDASAFDSLQEAKSIIYNRLDKLDCVVYMSGIYHPMDTAQLELSWVKSIVETNLLGPMYITQLMINDLLNIPNSQLVFCASVAGYRGLPNAQPYGASKAGLINFVQSIHAEYGRKLDIKLINPGFVQTRLTDKNQFSMPFIIAPEQAATAIVSGLLKHNQFEIHFPKRFTLLMKCFTSLPYWLYHRLVRR
ncbi:SDR family NAD(P)-dependent oxidoreductase [Thorsellia anophelis]|uniref:Short-chain dehydrogenase n=1 Tax=Thorsellia anophelis DSM 18579 TaxID=1123402 RepID=A0A1H9YQ74_9GAMM|nr:SDR family NAD(P)-dependent oxidoreductase [Thorsellia anophelis]SES71239.1 Short-chain dehydrogenase [Thorsellia anophelis DSM 18579]